MIRRSLEKIARVHRRAPIRLIAENVDQHLDAELSAEGSVARKSSAGNAGRADREQRDSDGWSWGNTSFDDLSAELEEPERGMLFHDGSSLPLDGTTDESDQAKNALMHNFIVELLRKQFVDDGNGVN